MIHYEWSQLELRGNKCHVVGWGGGCVEYLGIWKKVSRPFVLNSTLPAVEPSNWSLTYLEGV